MATLLYPLIEKFVSDEWIKLEREQITPWVFMTAGPPFQIKDYYGKQISYQGVAFEGSPRDVFWGRYIEPFIENIVDISINKTLRLSNERNQNAKRVLPESGELLKSIVYKSFERMADIDLQLRGKDYPKSVSLRNTDSEIEAMTAFIDRRINAEISMIKPRLKINEFYNEHTFLFWFITLFLGAVVSLLAT